MPIKTGRLLRISVAALALTSGAAAAALVRDALSDSFGEENVTDAEPADGDEQEYICLMKVVLDEQSATCGLVREGSELRADVASGARRRPTRRRRAAHSLLALIHR